MTEEQKRVNELITRLEEHQQALGVSDKSFTTRYRRYIGSPKQWRDRLCGRNWGELTQLDKWARKLLAFVGEIDGVSVVEEYYDKIPIAKYVTTGFEIMQAETSDRRCFFLVGKTGVGKTVVLRNLYKQNAQTSIYIRANETWKKSQSAMYKAFAISTGAPTGWSASGTFVNTIDHLKSLPVTIMIDEAHEGGVALLKMAKTLIDETRSCFILSMYPTQFLRLVNPGNDAYSEAQQLLGRAVKPINMSWISGLRTEDVAEYMRAAGFPLQQAKPFARRVLPALHRSGNLRVLADAVKNARIMADYNDAKLNLELVQDQVEALSPSLPSVGRRTA